SVRSHPRCRVGGTTSAARSHADATAGPKPNVAGIQKPATKPGSSRSRALKSEQPSEPLSSTRLPQCRLSSHSQERTLRVADSNLFVGIDVCSASLDLCSSNDETIRSFSNDAGGIAALVDLLAGLSPKLIVIESTGGLERPLLLALLAAHLPVALVDPTRARL